MTRVKFLIKQKPIILLLISLCDPDIQARLSDMALAQCNRLKQDSRKAVLTKGTWAPFQLYQAAVEGLALEAQRTQKTQIIYRFPHLGGRTENLSET